MFPSFLLHLIYNPTAVTGVLKGYDQLLNLVLDDVQEEKQGTPLHSSVSYHTHCA